MKKEICLAFMLFLIYCAKAQPPDGDSNWELVFNDDFNSINTTFWNVKDYYDANDQSNSHIMLANNVNIVNNMLEITTKSQALTCPTNYQNTPQNNPNYPQPSGNCNKINYNFTSGFIGSKNFVFHYGYYEAKIKMDYAKGHWPSFFLLGRGSEVDIFEMVGNSSGIIFKNQYDYSGNQSYAAVYSPNKMNQYYMTTNVHGTPLTSGSNDGIESPHYFPINDYTQWHTYGLEFLPDRISWYVDGVMIRQLKNVPGFDPSVPFEVIFGSGVSDQANQGTNIPNAKMTIDYLRYYKLKGNCWPAINQTCYNFSQHTDESKSIYQLGGSCYNIVPSNKPYFFKAVYGVDLKDEYYVPVGAQFIADAQRYCEPETRPYHHGNNCYGGIDVCQYNFCCYTNNIYNFVKIGGNNCTNTISSNQQVKLRAIEYIKIDSEFAVPLNSEVSMKIENCPQ